MLSLFFSSLSLSLSQRSYLFVAACTVVPSQKRVVKLRCVVERVAERERERDVEKRVSLKTLAVPSKRRRERLRSIALAIRVLCVCGDGIFTFIF